MENPHLDRWHYLDYRDGKHDKNYIEWKYFNFIQKDLAGYVVYYILDPEKRTRLGGGRLLWRIFKDGKSFGGLQQIPMDQIQCDSISANITMNGSAISEKSPYEYGISGAIENFAWNLDYKQATPTIDSFHNVNSGMMRWENVNWLVKMPKARVSGEIKINNETIAINALGYTDTNWGEIAPFFSRYEWGQFNDEDFSFTFGLLYGIKNIKNSYFYFTVDNKLIKVEGANWKVEHTAWTTPSKGEIKIPSQSNFTITNGEYVIKLSSRLVQYDILGIKIYWFLPKSIVSEQLVSYSGTIEKNGVVIKQFEGTGFQEWSTKTWKPISLIF
ncbi:hypothetical protein KW791_01525 [Candidatus Parcubacteria bacterium]|nr:hypothetical protein [Candidatus Parcubacteria bacterium]